MISEFNATVAGVGVAIAALKPEQKKVSEYTCLIYIDDIPAGGKEIPLMPNNDIF